MKKGEVLTDYFSKSLNSYNQTQDRASNTSSQMSDKDSSPADDPVTISDSSLKQPAKKRVIEATFEDVDRIMSDIRSSCLI